MGFAHPFRDELDEDFVPDEWTAEHVEHRLIDAYRTLRKMPGGHLRPKAYGNAWPEYQVEWEDLLAQAERPDPAREMRIMQRATPAEIQRMEQALGWALSYLRGYRDEARALSKRNMAKALDIPLRRIARREGLCERALRRTALHGARIVAGALNRAESPVF